MKIILTQNVPNLGSLGDEIQVKDGYARNFLLPRGMAMPAGGKNAREIQHRQHFLGKIRAEAIEAAQGESEKVAALELTVQARAGTGGRLFGSVTNRDLQALIAGQGFELDRKSIQLHTPVKSLGTFGATIKLHTDVKVELQFKVVAAEIVGTSPGEDNREATEEGSGEPAGETPAGESVEAAGDATKDDAGDGTTPPAALDTAKTANEASGQSTGDATENTSLTATDSTPGTPPKTPPEAGGDAAGDAAGGGHPVEVRRPKPEARKHPAPPDGSPLEPRFFPLGWTPAGPGIFSENADCQLFMEFLLKKG